MTKDFEYSVQIKGHYKKNIFSLRITVYKKPKDKAKFVKIKI